MGGKEVRERRLLTRGDVKTALLEFVLDIADILLAQVSEHFAEDHLQGVAAHFLHGAAVFIGHLLETFPTYVEGCAVEVGRVETCVGVTLAQVMDVFAGAGDTGDGNLVWIQSFILQRVEEVLSDGV